MMHTTAETRVKAPEKSTLFKAVRIFTSGRGRCKNAAIKTSVTRHMGMLIQKHHLHVSLFVNAARLDERENEFEVEIQTNLHREVVQLQQQFRGHS